MSEVEMARARFAAWIKTAGLNQYTAADLLGIRQSTVNNIVNGKCKRPTLEVMLAIERATRGIRGGAIRVKHWGVRAREPKVTGRARKRRAASVNPTESAA